MPFDPDSYLQQKTAAPRAGGFNPDAYLEAKSAPQPGLLERGANALHRVGRKIDSFTGAPVRSAIGAIQDGENPLSAYVSHFGADPDLAPTGKDIAAKAGFSTEESPPAMAGKAGRVPVGASPAGLVGAGVNFVADPFVLAAPFSKAVGSGARAAGGLLSKGVEAGAKATDLATGTNAATNVVSKAGKAAQYAGESIDATKLAVKKIFSPKQAGDFPEMAAIAKKNGIDPSMLPESVEFGNESFISTAAKARREGVVGEPHMAKFRQGYQAVQDAFQNKLTSLGGRPPMDAVEAGNALRQGFDNGAKRFRDSIDMTRDSVQKYAPGLYIDKAELAKLESKVNSIEKYAKGLATRGIDQVDRTQGQYLLNAVAAYREGRGTFKQTVEALRSIGKKAFSPQAVLGQIPHDVEKMRDLYFSIDEALTNTVAKHVNPEFAAQMHQNNQLMKQFYKDRGQIGHILADPHIAPETAFKRIVMNGDTDQIKALKKFLTPQELNQQKAAFITNLIKREPDGSFNLNTLYRAMRNKQNTMTALFDPQEIQEIGELVKLGDRFGNSVLSTSGTGRSNVFHHIADSLQSGIANDTLIESLKDKARGVAAPKGLLPAPVVPETPAASGGLIPKSPIGKASKVLQQESIRGALAPRGGLIGSSDRTDRKPAKKKGAKDAK